MANNYPRDGMNQLVTADDIAKLEGIALPYNAYVIHEDHLGGKTIASGEADIQGIVVRGHRLCMGLRGKPEKL